MASTNRGMKDRQTEQKYRQIHKRADRLSYGKTQSYRQHTYGQTDGRTDLLSKSLDGSDKDASGVWGCREHAQNGKLSTDGLATASGGPDKHIIIRVVEGIEYCREGEEMIERIVSMSSLLL